MTLIKKADVKNHLSARRRTGIHLHRPESQPDATGFAEEETIGNTKINNPEQGLIDPPTPVESGAAPLVTSKSAQA